MSYLEAIKLEKTLPCLAESGKLIVIGKPARGLEAVLPYLATLPGVIVWNPEAQALTFRRQSGFVTLYAGRVIITQVSTVEEGLDLLKALVEAINATWERRAELEPARERQTAPQWLDVWRLLPQTNCQACGEATCMAFAAAVLQRKRSLVDCLPLATDAHFDERRATLEAMLS